MSPRTEPADHVANIGPDEDFILIRVSPDGEVVSLSTLDEDEAIDLLRQTADEIESDGFERKQVTRLS